MIRRRAAGAALVVGSCCFAADARAAAWTEVHQTSSDVRVAVEPNGLASFEHTIALRVVMGPIKTFDVVGIDRDAQLEPATTATAEDGRTIPAHVAQAEARGTDELRLQGGRGQVVRVAFDDPKGLKRGLFTLRVRYKLDLVATRTLVRDGALWRFAWTAPIAPEGFDTAKMTLELPPAPTEPRPVRPPGEDGVLATLRRLPERDELELVRPHVSRGDAVTWEARIDPKALPAVSGPELRPPPRPAPPPPSRWIEVAWALAVGATALAFAMLVRAKARWMQRACARAKLVEKPLIPLPPVLRPVFAGAALACAMAVQLLASPAAGALLVALAAAITVFRAPAPRATGRGPGKWIALEPRALRVAPAFDSWLDVGTPRGRRSLGVVLLVVALAAFASRWLSVHAPYFVAIDALAILPLWFSGRAVQLRPERARLAQAELLGLRDALASREALRVTPWARIPQGGNSPEEVRLLALPEPPLPGLIGIEVGFGLSPTPTGWLPSPQVLVRMHDESAASCRVTSLRVARAIGPGRGAHERVASVAPADADVQQVRSLVERLADDLRDRRGTPLAGGSVPGSSGPRPYPGPERRLPPDERQELLGAERARVG